MKMEKHHEDTVMIRSFKKNFVFILNEEVEDGAKYCIPTVSGEFSIADCFLLDNDFRVLEGYEYPVQIARECLGEIVSHVSELYL